MAGVAHVPYLERRPSGFFYRRRIPAPKGDLNFIHRHALCLSLRTHVLSDAKILARRLTALSDQVFAALTEKDMPLARPDVESLLVELARCELEIFEAVDAPGIVALWHRVRPQIGKPALRQWTHGRRSAQAAARIRPIAPRHPKRMVLLCNIPLPGLPVTKMVPFAGACRDLMDDPDPSGFIRLEAAFVAMRDRSILGARLSAAGLLEDLHRDFKSMNTAKEFRRGRSTSQMFALARRIAARNNWSISCLELCRANGGGTPTPAVVFCEAVQAVQRANAFWPGYIARILL